MRATDLIAELVSRDVTLWVRPDGRIGFRGPRGAVTDEHLRRLRELREAVVLELAVGDERNVRSAPAAFAEGATTAERPLTNAELDVWLYLRRGGDPRTHLLSAVFNVAGALDIERLRAALGAVSARHPALRSCVEATRAVMRVHDEATPRLVIQDLPDGASEAFVDAAIDAFLAAPCDVTEAPLLSVLFLGIDAERHVLVVAGHHLVVDDESLRIVAQEVLDRYDDPTATWRAPQNEQQDAADVIARRPRSEPSAAELTARRDELLRTSRPEDRLPGPTADDDPEESAARGTLVELDASAVAMWRDRRRRAGVTTQVQELALLALAIRAAGGPAETIVGMPDFGRRSEADWSVVGYLSGSLLLRCSLRGCRTLADLQAELRREVVRAGTARHDVTHPEVAERGLSRVAGHHVWLATYAAAELAPPSGLALTPRAGVTDRMRHDVRVAFFAGDDRAALHLGHRPQVVSSFYARRLADCLTRLHRDVPSPDADIEHLIDDLSQILRDDRSTTPGRGTTMEHKAQSGHKDERQSGRVELDDLSLLDEVRRARRARRTPSKSSPSVRSLVTTSRPARGSGRPLPVVQAQVPGVEMAAWLSTSTDEVAELLGESGVVLLRGFSEVESTFADAVETVSGASLLDYSNRSTPRTRVEGNVFTSTEYPAEQTIPQHSEQAYSTRWPLLLGFHCATAALEGGETPLASTVEVLEALDPRYVDRFAEEGVLYERWFHPHVDLGRSEVFGTDDRDELARNAAADGIQVDWDGDLLRTRQLAQGVVTHPVTGLRCWFNQAHLFHPASLSDVARTELERNYGERMPRNAYYGSGEPIPDGVVREVLQAMASATWSFRWEDGDLMLVDNVAMTHGRRPFVGPRRVLVAMAGSGGSAR